MIYTIIYIIISLVLGNYYWNKLFKADYDKAKNIGRVDDSIVIISMLFTFVAWPILICKDIIKFLKK